MAAELRQARIAGASFREIGEHLGHSESWARAYVKWADLIVGDTRPCLPHVTCQCGELFTPSRSDARYHSNACRQRAYRKRKLGPA
jgi:hypothetical protein